MGSREHLSSADEKYNQEDEQERHAVVLGGLAATASRAWIARELAGLGVQTVSLDLDVELALVCLVELQADDLDEEPSLRQIA